MQSTTQMVFTDRKIPIETLRIKFSALQNSPIFTLLLGVLASAIAMSPQMTSWLQFDRSAILDGEIWRTLTGHLTHWSASHLFWDMLMFLALAGVIELFSRRQFLIYLASVSLFISLLVFIVLPEMTFYRGLSGIDSGLFMLLVVILYRRKAAGQDLLHKIPYILLGLLIVGKISYELSTAQAIFVQPSDLFVPVPLAHLGGAFVGWIVGTLHSPK